MAIFQVYKLPFTFFFNAQCNKKEKKDPIVLKISAKNLVYSVVCLGDAIVTVDDWLITVMDRPYVSWKLLFFYQNL